MATVAGHSCHTYGSSRWNELPYVWQVVKSALAGPRPRAQFPWEIRRRAAAPKGPSGPRPGRDRMAVMMKPSLFLAALLIAVSAHAGTEWYGPLDTTGG